MKKHLLFTWWVLLSLLTAHQSAWAQRIDPTFTGPSVYQPGQIYSAVEQPDGKRLLAGRVTRVNGAMANGLVRMSATGVVDAAFQKNLGDGYNMYRPKLLSNGQILVISLGATMRAGGIERAGIMRLNADGTADATFNAGSGPTQNGAPVYADDFVVLPDGKIIVVGPFDRFSGVAANRIVRLLANGSVDNTFNAGIGADREIETIVRLSSGKLLIGGIFQTYNGVTRNGIARINADGTLDETFVSQLATYAEVTNITVQPNGKIIICGAVNTLVTQTDPMNGIARLEANGIFDLTFKSYFGSYTTYSYYDDAIQLESDGKILALINSNDSRAVVRLQADGSEMQPAFSLPISNKSRLYSLIKLKNGNFLTSGIIYYDQTSALSPVAEEFTTEGIIVSTFKPVIQNLGSIGFSKQSDGKLLLNGSFTEVNGKPLRNIARLTANGDLDASFKGVNVVPFSAASLSDDRLLVYDGNSILRFLSSGEFDPTFYSTATFNGYGISLVPLPNGKVLVSFSYGNQGNSLVRLNADGSQDNTFATRANLEDIKLIRVQSDGKILVIGESRRSGSGTYQTLERLSADGADDPTFQATTFGPLLKSQPFQSLTVQPNGAILLGGDFSALGSSYTTNIMRFKATGEPDASFTPPAMTGRISQIVLDADNRILLGGAFTSGSLPSNLARLKPDGSADASFTAATQPNGSVSNIVLLSDGRLLVSGNFTKMGTADVAPLVRLTFQDVLPVRAPQSVADRTAIWPVPAHGRLHVAPAPQAHAQQLELLNLLGQVVRQAPLGGMTAATLAVEGLAPGTYLVRVTYAEGAVTRGIQIQ